MGTGTITGPLPLPRQHWWAAGLLVLFVVLSVQHSFKVGDEQRSAILRWRPQIQHVFEENIYERYTYPNPPIMALLLMPVTALPPLTASLVWFYLKVGMTLLAIHWAFRLVESPGSPLPLWGKALTVLLSLRPIMGDLSHGNVNLFILFLVVAALIAYRQQYDFGAGVILGLAIACKVTPALFVPYFLWKRAWRTLAGCATGLVLFLFVVPGLFLGMARNVELFQSWYGCMVRPYVEGGAVTTDHPNQSLPGLVYRWFTPGPSFYEKGIPQESSTIVTVDPTVLRWFLKGCMAAFAALVVWSCRTPTQPRHGWRLAAEFSLILVGMLLFSERTWKHHCVTLLLPFAVVVYYLAVCRPGPKLRAFLIAMLAAVVLLMTSTSTGLADHWDRTARLAQADGAYVWANLCLVAGLITMLRRKTAPEPANVMPSRSRLPTF